MSWEALLIGGALLVTAIAILYMWLSNTGKIKNKEKDD